MFPNNFGYGLGLSPFYTFAVQNFPFIEKDFDALTDYQLMCKIFKYLDDEIKKVDSKYAGIYDTVAKLESDFNNLESDFDAFKIEINATIADYKQQINNEVDYKLEEQYNRLIILLNQYKLVFEAYVDSQIATVNQRIDDVEVGAINIYNPISGTIDPISVVIDDLYNQLRYDAITASEYDGLELTATTYDGYMITANNFDLNGKSILMGN